MKRRPAWFYEWTEPQPTADDPDREWRLRVFWQPARKPPSSRFGRRNMNALLVKRASQRELRRPPIGRGGYRWVWVTTAWMPRADIEKALSVGIPCQLLRDERWPRQSPITRWTPQRCAEVLVALDAWLEQSPTS